MTSFSNPSNQKNGPTTPSELGATPSSALGKYTPAALNPALPPEGLQQRTILSIAQPTLDILTKRVGQFDFTQLEKNPLVATTCNLLLMYHPDPGRQSWASLRATETLPPGLVLSAILHSNLNELPLQAKNHVRVMAASTLSPEVYTMISDLFSAARESARDSAQTNLTRDYVPRFPLDEGATSDGDRYALTAFSLLKPFASQSLPATEFSDVPLRRFWETFPNDLEMQSFAASFAALQGDTQTRSRILRQIDELNLSIGEAISPLIEQAIAASPLHQTSHMSDSEYLSWVLRNP